MDKNQPISFTSSELDLIKSTFSDDSILYGVRNVLFQFEYDEQVIKRLTPDILSVLKKVIVPSLSVDYPIKHQEEFYFGLSTIREMTPEVAEKHIEASDIAFQYLNERFSYLEGKNEGSLILTDLKQDKEDRFVSLFAFLTICARIEDRMQWLKTCAGKEELTPSQIADKQRQDSNK